MPSPISLAELRKTQKKYAPGVFIDLENRDLESAHQRIGAVVRPALQDTLRRRLDALTPEDWITLLRRARRACASVQQKAQDAALHPLIRSALHEYQTCLQAWAQGAALREFEHALLVEPLEGQPVTEIDLAYFLQDEYSGCQTGLYRDAEGAVLLWHSEEDAEREGYDRFDQVRVVSMCLEQQGCRVVAYSFLYPNLMPGSAFNWRSDGYLQAVDTLHINTSLTSGDMLANTAAWVTLRLGQSVPPPEVIQALGPYQDGYALLWAGCTSEQASAGRVEFGGEYVLTTNLPDVPNAWLFQVNAASEPASTLAKRYEILEPNTRQEMHMRQKRTAHFMRKLAGTDTPVVDLLRLLSSRAGAEYAYCNVDVKSTFVARLSPSQLKIWLTSGPSLPGVPPGAVITHAQGCREF